MGQGLPKAVTSVVVKRVGATAFRIGFAEMNGWRPSMEDANVIIARDTWGFFGVFDGHGGDQCSGFVARRLYEELSDGPPEDHAALSALALRLDKEFLELGLPSGSTGTFVIVKPPEAQGGKYLLRVGNIGDSRVLLGRADGTIVVGSGTDGALTTDHKPDHPSERARIERTGGNVQEVMGVSRVNGDLAVSRAFGDSQHKQTGGPSQEDHPVSAAPELCVLECGPTDFIMLVCDGISEGTFPNAEVVKLAAEQMNLTAAGGQSVDPGSAAAAVCREALKCGSKDNLSCMIVLLGGGEVPGAATELVPGPFDAPEHGGFRKAYAAMAEHAGLTLPQAIAERHDHARRELQRIEQAKAASAALAAAQAARGEADKDKVQSAHANADMNDAALKAELAAFGDGPPDSLPIGSEQRTQWFVNWLSEKSRGDGPGDDDSGDGPGQMTRDQLLDMLNSDPRLLAMAESQGLIGPTPAEKRAVRVAPFGELRPAVEAHPALKWDDRLADVCGQEGVVLRDDESDGTSQVKFPSPLGFKAWLPTSVLIDMEPKRLVRVAPVDELRAAVEAHHALKWDERLLCVGGQEGIVVRQDDSDGTCRVRFPPPLGFAAWFPTSSLTDIGEAANGADADAGAVVAGEPAVDPKRQRLE